MKHVCWVQLLACAAVAAAAPTAVKGECRDRPLLCGEVVTDTLSDRDCSLGGGSFGDRWVFWDSNNTGAIYTVAASTTSIPAQLSLSGRGLTGTTRSVPPGGVATITHDGRATGVRAVTALVSSDPGANNALGAYSVGLACELERPCQDGFDAWSQCLGQSRWRPDRRFLLQGSWEDPAAHRYGFGQIHPLFPSMGAAVTAEDGIPRLFVTLVPSGERMELRYAALTEVPYKLGITDLRTGATSFFGPATDGCAESNHDTFPSLTAAQGGGRCRPSAFPASHRSCFDWNRFAVEASSVRRGRGRSRASVSSWMDDQRRLSGSIAFDKQSGMQVFLRFRDSGDGVHFDFVSLSDREFYIDVTDTLTGEKRTYHNPAGRLCATSVAGAFAN